MNKFLKVFLIVISCIFIGLTFMAVLLSLREASINYYMDWSYAGLKTFISIFSEFKEVFAATIILITFWYTIQQYMDSQKLSRKDHWFDIFKSNLNKYKDDNLAINEICLMNIEDLFEYSEKLKRVFKNEKQLKEFLYKFIKPWINKIETISKSYEDFKGLYPYESYSHSSRTFFNVMIYVAQPSSEFKNAFISKYEEIYSEIIKNSEFGKDREINSEKFTQRDQELSDLRAIC